MSSIHNTRYSFQTEMLSESKITRAAAWARRKNELAILIRRARQAGDEQLEQKLISDLNNDKQLAESRK